MRDSRLRALTDFSKNDDAAEAHVTSDHFRAGLETMRPFLTATPRIISRTVDGDDWDAMGELRID